MLHGSVGTGGAARISRVKGKQDGGEGVGGAARISRDGGCFKDQ